MQEVDVQKIDKLGEIIIMIGDMFDDEPEKLYLLWNAWLEGVDILVRFKAFEEEGQGLMSCVNGENNGHIASVVFDLSGIEFIMDILRGRLGMDGDFRDVTCLNGRLKFVDREPVVVVDHNAIKAAVLRHINGEDLPEEEEW